MIRRELHVILHDTGHEPSSQCWCEAHIEETRDKDGSPITVFFHTDYTEKPHEMVLKKREENPGWITQFLESFMKES